MRAAWASAIAWGQLACTLAPNSGSIDPPAAVAPSVRPSSDPLSPQRAPEGLRCLRRHYGGSVSRNADGDWVLSFSGEDEFVFDDGLVKDEQQVLINPDLEDTLGPYLPGNCPSLAENRTDVGRARHEGLLRAVYGSTEAEVRRALVEVEFLGKRLTVHQRIAPALQRVAQASRALIVERDELRPYFARLGGGFRWRTVEGTDRLSPHAFGIAVDLDPKGAAYWRWNSAWNGEYPRAIVEAFEAQGFIWGGNWEHFDSMHFEYRPELLDERCSDSHR